MARNYTYDAVGNITNIVDASGTNGAGTYDYQYDELYRLTRASSTGAISNWLETYSYDALGNITNKSNVGAYTYAGTNYANPHAATSIGGTSYTYDNAGNLTQAGNTYYSWDYANRISGINANGTTTAYLYDQSGQRVEQDVKIGAGATTTTKYWNRYYETSGATTTLYLYLPNGELLGTIEGNGTATSTFIAHTDHLGGTNVLSDKDGNLAQLTNYYPYGAPRQNEKIAGFNEQRKYIGQFYDDATALSYLNARYYDGNRGQFVSEDPVARDVGMMPKMVGYIIGVNQAPGEFDQTALLSNPQLLNSYSYSADNPICYSDSSGKSLWNLSYGFSVGPISLNGGAQLEPGVGWQWISYNTLGLSAGASVKYDPNGHLTQPSVLGYVEKECDVVPLVGGYKSTQADFSPSDPFNFQSNPTTSNGWAVGAQIGCTYSKVNYGPIQSTQPNAPAGAVNVNSLQKNAGAASIGSGSVSVGGNSKTTQTSQQSQRISLLTQLIALYRQLLALQSH